MAEKEVQHSSQELYQGKYRIKSVRATWCNYNEGLYFITICTAGKRHFFGEIKDAEMLFSEIGEYAQHCLSQIEQLHRNVVVPYCVVMPNHVHIIISITTDQPYADNGVETSQCGVSTVNTKMQKIANHCGRLSHLISQFKSSVTKYARQNAIEFGWQSRFHDHIIRNQDVQKKISDYIQTNNNIRKKFEGRICANALSRLSATSTVVHLFAFWLFIFAVFIKFITFVSANRF